MTIRDLIPWSNRGRDISVRKRTETEDKDRLFSERFYGRFERRIPVDEKARRPSGNVRRVLE
jgi:HSP20 family molecular chaperone IbpA